MLIRTVSIAASYKQNYIFKQHILVSSYQYSEQVYTKCILLHDKNTCDQDMHNTQRTLSRCVRGFDELHWIDNYLMNY